jgi:hypothetical protein
MSNGPRAKLRAPRGPATDAPLMKFIEGDLRAAPGARFAYPVRGNCRSPPRAWAPPASMSRSSRWVASCAATRGITNTSPMVVPKA